MHFDSNMAPRCPKKSQDGPSNPKMTPSGFNIAPRWPQDGPKRPPKGPKMNPRWLQDPANCPQARTKNP